MATKIQVLADPTYEQYIMMGMVNVSRTVLQEVSSVDKAHLRKNFAKSILRDPTAYVLTFKSVAIVSFNTATWETLSEAEKITGATTLCGNIFNEIAGI